MNNIPPSIKYKIGRGLYREPNHPICIVKEKVLDYFSDLAKVEIDTPFVPIAHNFDKLRVPKDHPSRQPSDTFYEDDNTVLRTHMTCYLYPMGQSTDGRSKLRYITTGDVYRKDAIDATHFPVFHQMDAFYIVDEGVDVGLHLRNQLHAFVKHMFGPDVVYRFLEDHSNPDVYFPFTINSLEVEVEFKQPDGSVKKLEILGAGQVHPEIMNDLGLPGVQAWAFGLGLERLAMVMFDIPDIRLFWSQDKRFTKQFKAGQITKFKHYSKYESCYKDVSFFLSDKFTYNDLCVIARDVDRENLIESIELIDSFKKKERTSHCYRVTYRSMDRTLLNDEVDEIQNTIRQRLVSELGVDIR